MMRVLQIVTRSESGGAQSVVASLSSELAARGHEVIIASGPEGHGAAWHGLDGRIGIRRIPSLVRSISLPREFLAARSIRELYESIKPDIVHLHTSKAGALGRIARGIDRRRIVYTMHGFDQLRISNRAFLAVDKLLRHRCGAVVAVSEADRTAMEAQGYHPRLVRNGSVDALLMEEPNPAFASRLADLRKRGQPLVILIARDAKPKRIDLAREAARKLSGVATIAWIGGDAGPSDPYNFVALGTATAAGAYLRHADIFLLLSDHEGLSISLLEALSAGLPCVVSAVDGCLEALGIASQAMPSGKPIVSQAGIAVENALESIVWAISTLAEDPALRKRMGERARVVWAAEYSSQIMTDGYIGLYREILGKLEPREST